MKPRADAAIRRSKRQKGEDASVKPLNTQKRRRRLTGQTAEETATDMQIGTQESALEEHPLEHNSEKENEGESLEDAGEEQENEGEPLEKDREDPKNEGESPEDAGEELEKGYADDTQHPTEPVQGEHPETKTKRRRERTRMSKVAKNIEDKVEVEFIGLGEHVGDGLVTLSSFLGHLVREHVPVLLGDWRHLDEQTKDTMWEEIQVFFLN